MLKGQSPPAEEEIHLKSLTVNVKALSEVREELF